MTRFDAATPTERRKLFADAVRAHRERASAYLTVEAEPAGDERIGPGGGSVPDGPDAGEPEAADPAPTPPWVQFAERTFNLDCTDGELDALEGLLEEYPEFRIDRLETPEDADGTNVRITARADENRLAGFIDRVFQRVYGRGEGYRAWVVEI